MKRVESSLIVTGKSNGPPAEPKASSTAQTPQGSRLQHIDSLRGSGPQFQGSETCFVHGAPIILDCVETRGR
ncbi:hypothetical protein VTN77DRAFT_880 [Rasamsonia byssochlamydoides]|uniref:uncharacterized protein n=1 Tax=Rasamsonia byssochlamydoides TaxID=89139 RepID=UPI0037427488